MYLSSITKPVAGEAGGRRWSGVGGNVYALGSVSLTTDISAEMVTAILPPFLYAAIGPAGFGVWDGLYTGATAVLSLVGAYAADRIRRRKAVAGLGYGLSAGAKLGLMAAGHSVPGLGLLLFADRTGKGLRSAPRDAIITLSSRPADLGRAFGVHRTMDSVGAVLGPLVAMAVLAGTVRSTAQDTDGKGFSSVFMVSFCFACLGVAILALFVGDRRQDGPVAVAPSLREAARLVRQGRLRRIIVMACLLGLVTIGDGFVYLLLQRRTALTLGWFPLMAVATALSYLLLATPLGALADRWGRKRMFLAGYLAMGAVYLLLASPLSGPLLLIAVLGLNGAFYAATDGVLMALAAPVVTENLRTTALAMIRTAQALAYLVSSVLFGLAWQAWGPATATVLAAVTLPLAMAASAVLLPDAARAAGPTESAKARA